MSDQSIAVKLAQKAGGPKLEETSDAPDVGTDGAHMSAQDIIKAIHARDPKGLAQALKDHGAYYSDNEVGGGSQSDQRGDSGAAARNPNAGYSAFKK